MLMACLNILNTLLTSNSLSKSTVAYIHACEIHTVGCSHLLTDHLGHHISSVDVDGADGHDFLSVARCELANQQGDKGV